MVTFYAGNTLDGLSRRILQAVPKDGTGRHIVLVPDRFSLAAEQALTAGGSGALMNVEVMTFARFAMRCLQGKLNECLTPEGCTMLLTVALSRVKDQLRYYRAAVDSEGFANEMYSSLVAIRNSGISSDRLLLAAEKMKGRMADKTRDIALIMSEYLHVLSQGYADPTTRLQALAEAIPHDSEIAATCFYIVDFYCFNQMQYNVIAALMAYAKELHIGYIDEKVGGENRRIFPMDLRGHLLQAAKDAGVFCSTILAWETLSPAKERLQNNVFGYGLPAPVADDKLRTVIGAEAEASIQLFWTEDKNEELRCVCAEICRLVRQEGYRYRDFALVCADSEGYADALKQTFADYDIPLFADSKVLLADEPPVRLLLDALDCVLHNRQFEHAMRVVKNSFVGIPFDEVDTFENYCRKYAIDYTRFAKEFTLCDKDDDLAVAERVRKRLNEALPDVDGCRTVGQFADAIEAHMRSHAFDDKLQALYDKQWQAGCAEAAMRTEQVPRRLREMLDMTRRLLADMPVTLQEFVRLMRSSLASVRISLLPLSQDCVYLGEAKDSHYQDVKVMFVVGAVDGVLPQNPQSGSILSDAFFQGLQMQDVVVYPSAKDEGRYSRFYVEQLLLLPRDKLYVSFPKRSAEGEVQTASILVQSLLDTFGLTLQHKLPLTMPQQVSNRANVYRYLLREQRRLTGEEQQALTLQLPPADKERWTALHVVPATGLHLGDKLYFRRDLTSISQLETYWACPYQHFVKYGLRAKERQEIRLQSNETGTVIHRVLELFFERYTADLDKLSADELETAISAVIDEALAENSRLSALAEGEQKSRIQRLRLECAFAVRTEVDLVRSSLYKPMGCEVTFGGKKGQYPAIPLGEGVRLRGVIDRIDAYGNKVVVIDYKTGAEHYELKYVYFGRKIQLYAYLGALRQAGFEPVGAFYKKINASYVNGDERFGRNALLGQVIAEPNVLFELEPALQDGGKGRLLPYELGKNGWQPVKDKEQMALSREGLDAMIEYTYRLMRQSVEDIRLGYIADSPILQACQYCPCYAMCSSGKQTPERKTFSIKERDFTDALFGSGEEDEA